MTNQLTLKYDLVINNLIHIKLSESVSIVFPKDHKPYDTKSSWECIYNQPISYYALSEECLPKIYTCNLYTHTDKLNLIAGYLIQYSHAMST